MWTHRWQSAPSYFARVQIIENGGGSGTAQKDAECGHIGGKANERALWTHRWQSVFSLPTKEGPALVPRGPPRRLQEAPASQVLQESAKSVGGPAPTDPAGSCKIRGARVQSIENGGGPGTAQKDTECGHIGGKANERALWTHRWQSVPHYILRSTRPGPQSAPPRGPHAGPKRPPRRCQNDSSQRS